MINYRTSTQGIEPAQLAGFFVGWPNPPSPEKHLQLLQQSSHVVLAVESSPRRVVGFITAVTDGVLTAYIPLLEVLPQFQGRGIGSELVHRMLSQLDGLYAVDLLCDEGLRPFYAKLGMLPATGMMLRRYDRQSG